MNFRCVIVSCQGHVYVFLLQYSGEVAVFPCASPRHFGGLVEYTRLQQDVDSKREKSHPLMTPTFIVVPSNDEKRDLAFLLVKVLFLYQCILNDNFCCGLIRGC